MRNQIKYVVSSATGEKLELKDGYAEEILKNRDRSIHSIPEFFDKYEKEDGRVMYACKCEDSTRNTKYGKEYYRTFNKESDTVSINKSIPNAYRLVEDTIDFFNIKKHA